MRLFKAQYKDKKTGKTIKSRKWYVDFTDHMAIRHRLPAFESKRASEAFANKLEQLVNWVASGHCQDANTELDTWVLSLPANIIQKLVKWKLVQSQRAQATRNLTSQIDEYIQMLKARDISDDYVERMKVRLTKIVKECGFNYFRDINQRSFENYLCKLKNKGLTATTAKHYLDALKTFLNWAKYEGRILDNPLAYMRKERSTQRKGALTPEQFIKLVHITISKNIIIRNTTGHDRGILYLLAGLTGLRKNELFQLRWSDLHVDGQNTFILARADTTKNAREAKQPIPIGVAQMLQSLRVFKKAEESENIFQGFSKSTKTSVMIKKDLKTAELPLNDVEGNKIVFHSLRNSYISFLLNSGAPLKVAQQLARHSDPKLTFNTYGRAFEETQQKAVSMLPDFGQINCANYLATLCAQHRLRTNKGEFKNPSNESETAILANSGLEDAEPYPNSFSKPKYIRKSCLINTLPHIRFFQTAGRREKLNSLHFPETENGRGFDSRLNTRRCVLQLMS